MPIPCRDDLEYLGEGSTLWQEWLDVGDIAARNELFEFYLPWSKKVAGGLFVKYRTPGLEWGDIVNFCAIGLLDAIDRFDPHVGTPFEAYAYKFLKGGVLRGGKCFMEEKVVTPSRARTTTERVESTSDTNDSFDAIVNAVVGLAFGHFLESGVVDGDLQKRSAADQYAQQQDFGKIAASVSRLEGPTQFVIRSHYFHQMKFTEIADVLQVSRARVSQLHHRGLRLIRQFYEEDDP